jgi:serine/threonine-protein kinase
MVDRYGHVYLIDFGASKHVEPNSTLTTSLALAYTPGYCPPELLDLSNETPEYYLQAIKDIGPWTDIYALGATIYNLLTDSIPPSKRRLDKEGRKAFSFPNNVTSSTRDLIVWMMKPDKEDRPQSIRSLLVKVSSTEETLVENPIKEANFGSTNQSPKDSNRDKKFNANVLDHNDDSSLWKYVIVALLVGAMVVGYIFYNGNMSNNKPQVEKASYQDYFDK